VSAIAGIKVVKQRSGKPEVDIMSYAAAAKQKSGGGSTSNVRPVPTEKPMSTAAAVVPAAPAPVQPVRPAPTQQGSSPASVIKVTALLTRNGPPPQNGRTNIKNAKTAPPVSVSPPATGGNPSNVTKQPNTTKGSKQGGATPKNSEKQKHQQQQPKKKNESTSQSQTAPGLSNKKKSGPSPGPSKKLKPSPKEITLGDLIKTPSSQQRSRKQHPKAQSKSSTKPPFSPPPPPRAGDPVPSLTMDDFPALSMGSNTTRGPSTLRNAATNNGVPAKHPSGDAAVGKINNNDTGGGKSAAAPVAYKQQQHPPTAEQQLTKSKAKKAKAVAGSPNNTKPIKATAAGASSSKSSHDMASLLGPKTITADTMRRRRDDEGGDELDLMRLLEKRQIVLGGGGGNGLHQSLNKQGGRQRIRPRKKKLTSLKKKVLEERLLNWRQLHPEVSVPVDDQQHDGAGSSSNNDPNRSSSTVCLHGFAEIELLEDEDEYQELIANLQEMASKIGPCKRTFIPRCDAIMTTTDTNMQPSCPAFVEFSNPADASAAVSCWHGLALGGSPIQVQHVVIKHDDNDALSNDEDWQQQCLVATAKSKGDSIGNDSDPQSSPESQTAKVILENVLTEDDMEDEDCLLESLDDCRTLAGQFGLVQEILVEREAMQVIVVYSGGLVVARQAAKALGQTVISGVKVSATAMGDENVEPLSSTTCNDRVVLLYGALTVDDLEDEECLEESLNDIRELALQFGPVETVAVEGAQIVRIQFSSTSDNAVVKRAVAGFNGMVIGGSAIRASLPESLESIQEALVESTTAPKPDAEDEQEHAPMFSGDKRIPERFAECKRVPKIPNAGDGVPRHYAVLTGDDTVKPLLIEMLGELMRLQKRAVDDKNAKARRRLVMGLREVARGIRSHKTKMVVMANNLDEYGIIDDKLQQILDLCREEGVPVFFEFNKRGLGKAIGKTIKIAVIG
jgi:ribosomal protein L7Ae-like RNA K-turn-binding protein